MCYCKWQLVMNNIVLQWNGHFLSLDKPLPLVMSRGFLNCSNRFYKKLRQKKETTVCIPKITALLGQSRRGFHPNELLEKRVGQCLTLHPGLRSLDLQKEKDVTFPPRIQPMPLNTTASLWLKAPSKHLLAFPCILRDLSEKGIKTKKIKLETSKEPEKKINLQSPWNDFPGLLLVRQDLIFLTFSSLRAKRHSALI